FYCITEPELAPPAGKPLTEDDLRTVPADQYLVFEPVAEGPNRSIDLRKVNNEIPFYAWDDAECCLPRGTTRATLRDEWAEEKPPRRPPPPRARPRPPPPGGRGGA